MMEQDTNKENLKKLLNFLDKRILSNPTNRWFANSLYKLIAPASEARISEIHEQCIESILKKQAEEFYADFAIKELRPQLIADFIKMEHWRRRNNVREFCMALYQQIEAITNHLCADNSLILIWRNIRQAAFFADTKAKDIKVRAEGLSVERSIVYNPKNYGKELNEFVAMDKFKAILFLIVYNTNVHWNNRILFNRDFFTGYNIYMVRNLNHRGNTTEQTASEPITEILNNPTFSMCSLLGFYAQFVEGINKNLPQLAVLVDWAETCCREKG